MTHPWLTVRNRVLAFKYRWLLKPVFFRLDPERVHDRMVKFGNLLGRNAATRAMTRALFGFSDPRLSQTLHGVTFPNPIGLSGGFDKNAKLVAILPEVGFGFMEIGSVTAKPYAGNPGQRLWRLPTTKSLVVNYGLMNDGADVIAERLKNIHPRIPLGINIAKTNNQETCELEGGVADYAYSHNRFRGIGQYETINVSCPNAFGGQQFHDPQKLEALLVRLDVRNANKPIFLKISPDLDDSTVDAIVDLALRYGVAGIICTNLTKKRDPSVLKDANVPTIGGLSGKAVDHLSDEMIARVYKRSSGKLTIIGCGGVFSAEDAYRKIKLGASLIQLITGMIYQGPQLISDINLGLTAFLERDGYKNISDAVGTANLLK